jgi:large repetitive protein
MGRGRIRSGLGPPDCSTGGGAGTRTAVYLVALATIFGSVLVDATPPAQAAAATTRPTISNYKASPATLTYTGGSTTLSATVTGASTCIFSSTSHVQGLPASVNCTSESASVLVIVAGNSSSSRNKVVEVKLTALGSKAHASASARITVQPAPPPPTISGFGSSPSPVAYTGGSATLSATVTGGAECTFSAHSAELSGLPEMVVCGSGTVSATVAVTANATTRAMRFPVELTVAGPVKSTVAHTFVTLAPAPPPTIASYSASPSPVSWTGGPVTLSAEVAHATTCTFSTRGSAARFVSGLPASVPCTSGSASVGVTVSANHRRRLKSYTVSLTVTGSGAKATTTTEVTVSPITTKPSISAFSSSPSPVPSTGGAVTLTATVDNAVSCTFSSKKSAVAGLPVTVPCSAGTVSTTVTVPAATSRKKHSYRVRLTVRNHGRNVSGTAVITVAGQRP